MKVEHMAQMKRIGRHLARDVSRAYTREVGLSAESRCEGEKRQENVGKFYLSSPTPGYIRIR